MSEEEPEAFEEEKISEAPAKQTFQFDEKEFERRRWGRFDEEAFGVHFDKLTIHISSSDVIRNQWSRGEVKKPETIKIRSCGC